MLPCRIDASTRRVQRPVADLHVGTDEDVPNQHVRPPVARDAPRTRLGAEKKYRLLGTPYIGPVIGFAVQTAPHEVRLVSHMRDGGGG